MNDLAQHSLRPGATSSQPVRELQCCDFDLPNASELLASCQPVGQQMACWLWPQWGTHLADLVKHKGIKQIMFKERVDPSRSCRCFGTRLRGKGRRTYMVQPPDTPDLHIFHLKRNPIHRKTIRVVACDRKDANRRASAQAIALQD